ncbi:GAD-like domain-containing protein [Thalassotalea ganghwensis]
MSTPFELDEGFKYFLKKFDTPIEQAPCSTETINKYTGKLPSRLLEYWQEYGFCGFSDGLFWIVNPEEYEEVLDEWLEPTNIPDNDVYHVFARNAFGDLFLWGEETGYSYQITASQGWIIEKKNTPRSKHNLAIERFFGGARPTSQDIDDEDGNPLFDQCVRHLGALKADEMFGFVPSLIAGGDAKLENVEKVNIFVHLSLLAQFGQIEVLDKDALFKKAFS